ncbi:MAG: hypothetical protein LBS28_04270 [Streptococcaceae bacterium]|jgi:hypothetical protein|nr:hypothetical protein [Streptococcaceae bacterium]
MRTYLHLFLKDLATTKYLAPILIICTNILCSIIILTPLKVLKHIIPNNTWMASTNPFENVFDITFVGLFFILLSFLLLSFQKNLLLEKTTSLLTKKQLVLAKYIYWLVFACYLLTSLIIFLKIYGYLSKQNILPIFLLFYAMFALFTALFVPLYFLDYLWLFCIAGFITFLGLALLAKSIYCIMNEKSMHCFNQPSIFFISLLIITATIGFSIFLSMKIVKSK